MKFLMSCILLATCFVSCITDEIGKSTRIRIIKNISAHQVEFIVSDENETSYHIAAGDSVMIEGFCETGAGDLCLVGWEDNSSVHGKIVFDNERVIIYENNSCADHKNPFGSIREIDLCSYLIRINEGIPEYIYTITEEDYQNAEPL